MKNISNELSEERTYKRGAPEHLKRGQAGRPRAMGPAGLGCSWPSSTSSFSGDFLVRFLASVQYIFCALHHPKPVHHSFLVLDVHLQHYFFTFCHLPYPMLHHSSHGAIFAENFMSFPCMAAPFFGSFTCGVGREHNSFPLLTLICANTLECARTRSKIVKTINTSSLPAPTG